MARRYRGSYSNSSFTREQLIALGIIGGPKEPNVPAPVVSHQRYPPKNKKPVRDDESIADRDDELEWNKKFIRSMRESTLNVRSGKDLTARGNMRYSEISLMSKMKQQYIEEHKKRFYFPDMPAELWPKEIKRKIVKQQSKAKVAKIFDDALEQHLASLEAKDNLEDVEGDAKPDKGSDSEVEKEQTDEDPEMEEDENDYGVSYFDNGEDYNDEDDNLDDGPTY